MRFKFLVVLLALAFTLPTLALAAKGYEIEYRGKGENGQEMVLVRLDSENIHLIPDEDNEVIVGPLAMVMIDHKKQEAFKTTYAEMKAMMSGMSDAMEQMASQAKKAMEEAKKGMTEEQIKAMEQYMPDLDAKSGPMAGKKSKNKYSYKHKGGDGKVAGHSVSRTEVFEDGKLVGKVWTTKDIPFTAVTNAIDNIMGIMPESAIRGEGEFVQMLEDLNGFPLKFHHVEDNATFEAVRVDEKSFSAKDWESPYPTKSMMEMMQGGGMGSQDDDDGGW